MAGLNYRQFKRTYPGDISFNFTLGLSALKDFNVKTYSNFYLTNRYKLDEVFDIPSDKVKAENIVTTIGYGDSLFLSFDKLTVNRGRAVFTNLLSTSNMNFVVRDNNICNIYYVDNYTKYYLVYDIDGSVAFIKERYLTFDDNINSQDFTYLFSEDVSKILLFKQTDDGGKFITKGSGEEAVANTVIAGQSNFPTYTANPLTLSRSLYYDPAQTLNFSFITYNEDNNINLNKSKFNLRNNFLLHKKYSQPDSKTDLLVLKNQLLVDDVFASANSLLSGGSQQLYVDDLREYTSIFNDIKEETTNDLELNYVFYNQSYKIKPGSNIFTAPSSMYPFTKLNINDSKFVPSGAFAHITPEFADKVYHVSREPQNKMDGQYLLCTWLSGSGLTQNKVWIDRYYYPDLIEKAAAIVAKPYQYPTYENFIEELIRNNSSLEESVIKQKIFDKKSDFVFEPNETYMYDRISASLFTEAISSVNTCGTVVETFPINYFKQLNNAGAFTFAFYFNGDANTWEIFSDRNAINAGINIVKKATTIELQYTLMKSYDGNHEIVPIYSNGVNNNPLVVKFKPLKENFVCISINSVTGEVYFCVNNNIVYKVPNGDYTPMVPFQYSHRRLLYGDFFVKVKGVKYNILNYDGFVYDPLIEEGFTPPELAFALPLIAGKVPIDDLYITLPCGMRNGSDNITLLQHLCDSSAFKSNAIDIIVKNLNIDNQGVLDGVTQTIMSSIKGFIPANSDVKSISFENFK